MIVDGETSPLNKENIEKAGKKVLAYARSVANGNASIRFMALVGGIALVIDSLSCFLVNILGFNFINAIINFYAFIVGASAVVMESDREAVPYAEKLRAILGENMGVVRTVTGRGLFYGVAATLEIAQGQRRSKVIGFVMLFVGLAYIVLGYSATEKLKEVRKKAFPARKVRELFQQYDVDDSGRIEFEEFFKLLKDMNVDIAVQEAELMYLSLDKDMNHGLRFEEFQGFWENSNELSFRI